MADEQFNQRPGARFDPQTGKPLQPMFDPQTGKPLQSQQAYTPQPAQQPVMQQQWDQGAAQQQAYAPTGQLAYQQPVYSSSYQVPVAQRPSEPSSLGNWVLTIIVSCIPIVGFIVLLVWAFGDTADISKKRWAQAMLIIQVAAVVISILAGVVFGVSLGSVLESM